MTTGVVPLPVMEVIFDGLVSDVSCPTAAFQLVGAEASSEPSKTSVEPANVPVNCISQVDCPSPSCSCTVCAAPVIVPVATTSSGAPPIARPVLGSSWYTACTLPPVFLFTVLGSGHCVVFVMSAPYRPLRNRSPK